MMCVLNSDCAAAKSFIPREKCPGTRIDNSGASMHANYALIIGDTLGQYPPQ